MKTYIYAHINPETSEVVYIGKGTGGRAWSTDHRRNAPHHKFEKNLLALGYVPSDWAVILVRGLLPEEASATELRLIKTLQPLFNHQGISAANAGRGEENPLAVLTEERVKEMRKIHGTGSASIRAIGRQFGVAYTTARKAITGLAWTHI